MAKRCVIPNVLGGFLGTFTSRYSDFDGYWLFGFLVEETFPMRIELLHEIIDLLEPKPLAFARRLAVQKFWEQVEKNGVCRTWIRQAEVTITKAPQGASGFVNGWRRTGNELTLAARVVSDFRKTYEATTRLFVTRHDPKVESRSARVG